MVWLKGVAVMEKSPTLTWTEVVVELPEKLESPE